VDSDTLAKLAAIGSNLESPTGELSLEEIQAKRSREEAARKELLDGLRERLNVAFMVIRWSGDMELGDPTGETRLDDAARAGARLKEEFEDSSDPEAFVIDLERQAKEAAARGKTARDHRAPH
jgi:hypothetical protein